MAQTDLLLAEKEINARIARVFREHGLFVLQEVRCPPCEIDIVILDPASLQLAGFEIKRRNWREVFRQACRTQLYCHFVCAVLPASMRGSVELEEFNSRGIGVIFYEVEGQSIRLDSAATPHLTGEMNRSLRCRLYQRFADAYGEALHA